MDRQEKLIAAFKAEIPGHLFKQMEKAGSEEEARNILPARYRPAFDQLAKELDESGEAEGLAEAQGTEPVSTGATTVPVGDVDTHPGIEDLEDGEDLDDAEEQDEDKAAEAEAAETPAPKAASTKTTKSKAKSG
jgi:hypothetical protein